MQGNYSVIPPFELYPILTGVSLITGTPLLYLHNSKTAVLGDIHLGQETSLFGSDSAKIGESCKELTKLILKCHDSIGFEKIVINGDIKHHTNSIKIQELEELKYFITSIENNEILLKFIKGNHDKMIEFVFPYLDMDNVEIDDRIIIDDILLTHGHLSIDPPVDINSIILSHEHPAYTFYGFNRAKVKLSSFATIKAKAWNVVILPAANSISLGTNYPPKSNAKFISPLLQNHADIKTMEIFPFDIDYGLLEIPPVSKWSRY